MQRNELLDCEVPRNNTAQQAQEQQLQPQQQQQQQAEATPLESLPRIVTAQNDILEVAL
jgi:hypothetical protein